MTPSAGGRCLVPRRSVARAPLRRPAGGLRRCRPQPAQSRRRRSRLGAVQLLRESRHIPRRPCRWPAVVTDPVDAIQLEAIAAELAFFLVQRRRRRRRHVGLVDRGPEQRAGDAAFELGPLATWPRSAPPSCLDALLKAVDDENAARADRGDLRARRGRATAADRRRRPTRLIKALDHYDPAIRSGGGAGDRPAAR